MHHDVVPDIVRHDYPHSWSLWCAATQVAFHLTFGDRTQVVLLSQTYMPISTVDNILDVILLEKARIYVPISLQRTSSALFLDTLCIVALALDHHGCHAAHGS